MAKTAALSAPDASSSNWLHNPIVLGALAGIAAAFMWASYLAFARAGVNAGLTPADFVFLRYATAGVLMLPWLLRHDPLALGGVGWKRGLILAAVAGPIFIFAGVGGYVFAPLAHGAVIQPSTITLATMAVAALVLGERITGSKALGAVVIIAGLGLIAGPVGDGLFTNAWIGDSLFIAAGLLWTVFTILLKRWNIDPISATAAVAVVSAMAVVPAQFLFSDFSRIAALNPSMLLTQIIVQGVFSGLLAVVAFGFAVRALGASKAALFPAIVPAIALLIGVPVTGEMPSALEWVGGTIATAGLLIAMGVIKRPTSRPTRNPHS